jgi:cytochrome c peroxidase
LRNVALTAPYMHDGSVATLEQVIDHYARGGHKNPRRDSRIRPLSLSPTERADLAAFLRSLTDREFVEDPRFR